MASGRRLFVIRLFGPDSRQNSLKSVRIDQGVRPVDDFDAVGVFPTFALLLHVPESQRKRLPELEALQFSPRHPGDGDGDIFRPIRLFPKDIELAALAGSEELRHELRMLRARVQEVATGHLAGGRLEIVAAIVVSTESELIADPLLLELRAR